LLFFRYQVTPTRKGKTHEPSQFSKKEADPTGSSNRSNVRESWKAEHNAPKKKAGDKNMTESKTPKTGKNSREKGTGSVFARGNKSVAVLPSHLRPPHQRTFATPEAAHAWLDATLASLTPHTIYLPKKLGEDATAKATENDTTLSRVVESKLVEYVKEGEES
jgi:hypothetical protein